MATTQRQQTISALDSSSLAFRVQGWVLAVLLSITCVLHVQLAMMRLEQYEDRPAYVVYVWHHLAHPGACSGLAASFASL